MSGSSPAAGVRAREGSSRAPAVVVTRDEPEDGPLSTLLRANGLAVLSWPVVRILPPADPAPLAEALAMLAGFDWIVFASQHAVRAVAAQVPAPPRARIAAVGARTAEALRGCGWSPDVVPEDPGAEALLSALGGRVAPRARVLLPASSRALPTLSDGLRRLGAQVVQVEAYRTEAGAAHAEAWRALIARNAVAAVTFTSPSAVSELQRAVGPEDFQRLLGAATAVALGPTTAGALREQGVECVLAEPATLEGLAASTFHVLKTRL